MKKNKFEFAFIIGDQFPDFSFLCATECIKIANRDRTEDFFTYKVYSIDNKNVPVSIIYLTYIIKYYFNKYSNSCWDRN